MRQADALKRIQGEAAEMKELARQPSGKKARRSGRTRETRRAVRG
jgi:hypothetical protein